MSDIPPTIGDVANALRIRDAVADRIDSQGTVARPAAEAAAERLILASFIDVARVHREIIDEDDDDFGL